MNCLTQFQLPPFVNKYERSYLVCLVKNINWIYVFWEITTEKIEDAWRQVDYDPNAHKILRVLKGEGSKQQIISETPIESNLGSRYLYLSESGQRYQMELVLVGCNRTVVLLSSNFIVTPFGTFSGEEDEQWASIDQLYESYSRQLGGTSPLRWNISSPLAWQNFQPQQLELIVDAELILYGRITPGATVYVQGEAIPTRRDGSFTLKYSLPEGCSIFPVKAKSFDGSLTKTTVPVITRETY